MKGFEFLERTGDLKFRAYGKSIGECFSNAANAMFTAMFGDYNVESGGRREVLLDAKDNETLLHDWLSELLYLLYAENLVSGNFSVRVEGNRLTASFDCEKLTGKFRFNSEVKAVTYHELFIKEGNGDWTAQVVCDT